MKGMLKPLVKEVVTGQAEVRQIFKVGKVGTIAGSYVTMGYIKKDSKVRLIRSGIVIYEGKLASLKRYQDDAKEVKEGFECGMMIENYNDIKENRQRMHSIANEKANLFYSHKSYVYIT